MIAEHDLTTENINHSLISIEQHICSNLISMISTQRAQNNTYFVIYDINGNEMVFEARDGTILSKSKS